MNDYESLSHTTWTCKYHVVFIPKRRRRTLYLELRRHLGEVFRKLAVQKESKVEEGHLMPDHLHMLLSIPPKYAVSKVVGYMKGTSAIHMARVYGERKRNFVGHDFWARVPEVGPSRLIPPPETILGRFDYAPLQLTFSWKRLPLAAHITLTIYGHLNGKT